VRNRTKITKGPGSRAAGIAMAYKLIEAAQSRLRAVNVIDKSTEQFLRNFLEAFEVFVTRVHTVLPAERISATGS
jgi:hypothetical protein